MLAIERHNAIKEMLQQQDCVTVTELSKLFCVTEETIRRDLEKLSAADKNIDRVHGGAYLIKNADIEAPIQMRKEMLIEEKRSIATAAADFVESGDCIMMDSSTTTLQLAILLKNSSKEITVITNSISAINELSSAKHIKVECVGGALRRSSQGFIGFNAVTALAAYRANKAFLSCSGIHYSLGITDNNEGEAQVRRMMCQNSSQVTMLIDGEKFGRCTNYHIVPMNGVNRIITNTSLSANWLEVLTKNDIDLICTGDCKTEKKS